MIKTSLILVQHCSQVQSTGFKDASTLMNYYVKSNDEGTHRNEF